jgi:polyphosphate kinase
MQKGLYKEGYTQNREISWLRYDDRVLNEAKDESVPLLERLKAVYFFTSNLTEFFRVRVGSLYDMNKAKFMKVDDKSGMTPNEQLAAIYPLAKRLCAKRDRIFEELRTKLAAEGVEELNISECSKSELKFLNNYFHENVEPLLNPQIVDTHHPFPNLQNHITYVGGIMREKGHGVFAFVPVPAALPKILVLPHKKKFRYVHTEDLIQANFGSIFSGAVIQEIMKLTVARSAYVNANDEAFEDIADYRKKMMKVLKERKRMNVTMLTCSRKPSGSFRRYLLSHMKITTRELFVCTVPTDLKYVFSLDSHITDEQKMRLCYEDYKPKLSPEFDYAGNLFDQVLKKDVMLAYPYESMEPFLQLVRQSANDPDVVSIRITIYRLAKKARLVDYLCAAAENGKEVDVLIELKARFDEQNNIDYSERLEDAGCNVSYGFDDYKVHSKICLISRVKKEKAEHVALIATGNFNENTAGSYTDFAMLTARTSIIRDAIAFFRNMSIGKLDGSYRSLLVAPVSLKSTLLSLMDREIAKGDKGYIFAKVNSITDEDIIEKLSEASQAGVPVRLLVRGISCLLPGIPGKTENVEIRSIVGRFLEHSRIYLFGTGASQKMYISSADFMTRNTERRVEIATPVMDRTIRRRLNEYISLCWKDTSKARRMGSNGRYLKIKETDVMPFNSQAALMRMTPESKKGLPVPRARKMAQAFHTKYKKKKTRTAKAKSTASTAEKTVKKTTVKKAAAETKKAAPAKTKQTVKAEPEKKEDVKKTETPETEKTKETS